MVGVTTQMIKELREITGAGILDCKKALEENDANVNSAAEWLRKKGVSAARNKAGRSADQGLIVFKNDGGSATILELNAETDFVSKNEKFVHLAQKIVNAADEFPSNSVEDFINNHSIGGMMIKDVVSEAVAVIGENIVVKRFAKIKAENPGQIISYVHNKVDDNAGKIGVLVSVAGNVNEEVEEFVRKIAMHIAAMNPLSLTKDGLSQEIINKERDFIAEQSKDLIKGKPEEIAKQMLEGRLRKFFEEVALMEQKFAVDGKTKVKDSIFAMQKKTGIEFEIKDFLRFELGENK